MALTVYVTVAALNYSLVQSYLGAAAGSYFSKEWGCELRVGALHAMPWDHVIVNNVLWVAPDGDTLLTAETVRVSFHKFPFRGGGLEADRVYLKNAYYHFACYDSGPRQPGEPHKPAETNLQFLIDYYGGGHPSGNPEPFPIKVKALTIDGVHYKMDLPEIPRHTTGLATLAGESDSLPGVEIAHMEYYDIHGRIRDIMVVNDDIHCRIVHLRTRERSGFAVNDIRGEVHVSPYEIKATGLEVRTPFSSIDLDAQLEYDGWEVMADYLNTVHHRAVIKEGTTVAMSDAAYWAPVLWGITAQVEAEGMAEGTINDLRADLRVAWGQESELLFTGRMYNIEVIDSAWVEADIERLRTQYYDITPLIAQLDNGEQLRPIAQEVGYVDLGGRFRLGMSIPSTANLALECGMGRLRADASLTPLGDGYLFDLEAGSDELRIRSNELRVRSGLSLSAAGRLKTSGKMQVDNANLQLSTLNTQVSTPATQLHLDPISLEGNMADGKGSLQLTSTDLMARLGMTADFDLRDSLKQVSALLDIDRLDLHAIGLTPEQFDVLKSDARISVKGKDLDHLTGRLALTGTQLGKTPVEQLDMTLESDGKGKQMELTSNPVDLTVTGHFDYNDLGLIVRQMACEILPTELHTTDTLTADEHQRLAEDTLRFHLHWKDDGHFLHTVTQGVSVARGTLMDGSYTKGELLKTVLRSDSIRIGTVLLDNVGLSSRNTILHRQETDYGVEAEAQSVMLGDMELLQRARLKLQSAPKRIQIALQWGDSRSLSTGDLMLQYEEGAVSVTKPSFYIAGQRWDLTTDNLTIAMDKGLTVPGGSIALRCDEQSIDVGLQMQRKQDDFVELTFDNFSLGGVTDLLLQEVPFKVVGDIGGHLTLHGLNETPYFNANLTIDSCAVNRQPLGDVQVRSQWNAELNRLNLAVEGEQLNAIGWLGLGEKDPTLDFNVNFNRFELGLAAPLLKDFSSRFEGQLHGIFNVTGTLSQPSIEGMARVEQGALQIDLTGVTYYFDNPIGFSDGRIILNSFTLRDPQRHTATVDGEIVYRDLNDIRIDLRLETDTLLVLDRRRGDEFYGTLLASATGTVRGPVNRLQVGVGVSTHAGSHVTVPVSDQRQVKAQNYITFVGAQNKEGRGRSTRRNDGQLNLEVDLNITPDLQLDLPMDFSDVKVNVGASGQGDLHVSLVGREEPQVMGSYEINSGTMKLGLMSLIEKTFSIESGSSLGFQGGLSDARFDLKAVHSQRVNLSTLTGSLNEVSGGQKSVPVDNIIAVSGTLQEPKIDFDLRIPNTDASVEEEVFAYIDRNSERDMLNQTLSLLVLGQFYNANRSSLNGNLAASGGIGALSGILSDMVGVVDINVDYKAANEVTKQQLDVNIRKDWGRWYLESTLGYGGESQELETQANGTIIDALVGYRLTPLMHLYAYNRTNTNDYTRMDLPYKQGIGLKLTKDFDRWIDLFKKKKR